MMKVYYFAPNLIGYLRVILNLSALYLMLRHPFVTVALHLTGNGILDVFDGAAARYFKQCSKFGELLDIATDRCGRVGFAMGLCALYPQYMFPIQLLVCLEIAGPLSDLYRRSLRADQKSQVVDDWWLLKIFFQEPILSSVILGQDICVYMIYLLYFTPGPTVSLVGLSFSLWQALAWLTLPFLIYRQIVVCGLLVTSSFSELARLHHLQDSKQNEKRIN